MKENHDWFVETVARFKPPNAKSKEALMSSQKIKIGPHELTVKPDFRDKALQVSSYLVSCIFTIFNVNLNLLSLFHFVILF